MTRTPQRSRALRFFLPSIGLFCALYAGEARADSADAEKLFREAKSLMGQKRYTDACPKLAESQRLDPSGGTILHLAVCHKEEGRIATSYAELKDALAFAERDNREDRIKAAKALMAELEPKLPKLTITVTPAATRIPGLEVKRDGALVKPSEWGAPLPVDPGSHTVTAWAPGRKPLLLTADLRGDAAASSVSIDDLEVDSSSQRPPDFLPSAPVPATRAAAMKRDGDSGRRGFWSTPRKVGLVVGSVGVAALGVGTVFGVAAAKAKNDSDAHCEGNLCDDEGIRIRESGMLSGNVATALFIGGGVAAAGGVVLMLAAPSSSPRESAKAPSVKVTEVAIGPSGAFLRGRF